MGSYGDLVLQLIDWLWIRLFLYAPSTAVPKLTKLAILALLTLNALPGTTQVGTVCIHLMGPSAHSQELWSNWHRIGLEMRPNFFFVTLEYRFAVFCKYHLQRSDSEWVAYSMAQ